VGGHGDFVEFERAGPSAIDGETAYHEQRGQNQPALPCAPWPAHDLPCEDAGAAECGDPEPLHMVVDHQDRRAEGGEEEWKVKGEE